MTFASGNIVDPDSPRHAFVNLPRYGILASPKLVQAKHRFAVANFDDVDGRAICLGDSGSGIIDFNQLRGRATLVGVLSSTSDETTVCQNAKLPLQREIYDASYVEKEPKEEIRKVVLAFAIKVEAYVPWIERVIKDHTGKRYPDDNFKTGPLKDGPNFHNIKHPATPSPPVGGVNMLPV